MCGIAGIVDARRSTPGEQLAAAASAMAATVRHRGPDAEGLWVDAEAGVALAHRRLAVIDLSDHGAQPMHSADGRWAIAYNGEVYNYRALRAEREAAGERFRGDSDTEVLLSLIARDGVAEALKRANAMCALAAWDRRTRTMWLARDRFGEKPLYWTANGGFLVFGSELRAVTTGLSALGLPAPRVNRAAVCALLRHSYVPAPFSIFEDVHKVEPATVLAFPGGWPSHPPAPHRYWSAVDSARQGVAARPAVIAEAESVERVGHALREAVTQRMVADVPLGAFLSGGIDSSVVVALMQASSSEPVKTFTIGFHETEFNEAEHAKQVAAHLGTDHTELYVSPDVARSVIPRLPDLYDEPFADSSQIPTFLVSELARRHVTVALSGDGGDEIFGGYNRYALLGNLWGKMALVPRPIRRALAAGLLRVPAATLDRFPRSVVRRLPSGAQRNPSAKVHKLARVLGEPSPAAVYLRLTSLWPDPARVVVGGQESGELDYAVLRGMEDVRLPSAAEAAMLLDTISYLPDDILVKVDRAAMAVSLETRVPFLDPVVYELAWSLPRDQRLDGRVGKAVLRKLLAHHVPRELFDRPKWGFGIPLGEWLRGPLRDWAGDLLAPSALSRSGYFEPTAIARVWEEHQAGGSDRAHELWNVIVFEQWLQRTVAHSTG